MDITQDETLLYGCECSRPDRHSKHTFNSACVFWQTGGNKSTKEERDTVILDFLYERLSGRPLTQLMDERIKRAVLTSEPVAKKSTKATLADKMKERLTRDDIDPNVFGPNVFGK